MLSISQLKAYFSRIGLEDPPEEIKRPFKDKADLVKPTLELLIKLHEQHVFSIPFENLSIHMNQQIHIDIHSIFKKLVENKRGGYCYEMNGLFYAILKTLGFNVQLHLAEVSEQGSDLHSREPTHLMLIVYIDNRNYLVDVGFGRNGLIRPLALEIENFKPRQIYSTTFEVRYEKEYGYLYGVHFNGKFNIEYRFDLPIEKRLKLKDLQAYSDDISTRSHFAKMILVSMPTKNGKKMLHNDTLKNINSDSGSKKIAIDNYNSYLDILNAEFGIKLDKNLCFSNIPALADKMITIKQVGKSQLMDQRAEQIVKAGTSPSAPPMLSVKLADDKKNKHPVKSVPIFTFFSQPNKFFQNSHRCRVPGKLHEAFIQEEERYKGYFHEFPKLESLPIELLKEKPKWAPKITLSQYKKITELDQMVSSNFGEVTVKLF